MVRGPGIKEKGDNKWGKVRNINLQRVLAKVQEKGRSRVDELDVRVAFTESFCRDNSERIERLRAEYLGEMKSVAKTLDRLAEAVQRNTKLITEGTSGMNKIINYIYQIFVLAGIVYIIHRIG